MAGYGGRGMGGPMSRGIITEEERKQLPKVTKELLGRVFGTLVPYWPRLVLVVFAILVSAALGMLPAILTGRMIDEGLIGGNFTLLWQLALASFGVLIASNLVGIFESYLNTWIAEHVGKDMKNKMFAHLLRLPQSFYTTAKQGDILTRMTSDISGVQSVITGTLTTSISDAAVLATSIVAMFQRDWLLALVGIGLLPLFIIPTKSVGKRRWAITLESQQKNDETNQILNETLSVSGQQMVKLFTNEQREYDTFEQKNEEILKLNVKSSMAGRWFRMAIGTFTSMGPILIYLVGGFLLLRTAGTHLSVGDITVMVALLTRMYRPAAALFGVGIEFTRAMALFGRIFEFYDLPVDIEDKPGAVTLANPVGTVSFEQVDFGYTPDKLVLEDINFELPAGKTFAVVGPSGAGKSSLVGLIPRLYDVSAGSVKVDSIDVRDISLHSLRENIGVVTQETYLFNGTIRDNLLYAKPNATQQQLEQACKKANIHNFIESLPQRYDTVVGNRGFKLSGGEKQRMTIARAILKDPRILILDEATSSLDSISESVIQEAIEPLLTGRTAIVIAHRLSTILQSDEILVLDKGRIVERGTHAELVGAGGVYTELFNTQFGRALEPANKTA